MGETLETLQRLQVVEQKRAVIRRTIEAKQNLIEAKRRNLHKIEDRLKQNHQAARELQVKLDGLSLDVAAREDSVSKHREALNRVKTNKEYAAILAAMNTEKADNSKIETEMIKLMDDLQVVKDAGTAIEAERQKVSAEVAAADAAVATHVQSCQAELDRLQTARDQWAHKVLPGALAVFSRIADRHEGEALALVTKPFPKRDEYSCSGCNMKVALEVVNTLRTRDEIQICKVCGRILCLESATAEKASS